MPKVRGGYGEETVTFSHHNSHIIKPMLLNAFVLMLLQHLGGENTCFYLMLLDGGFDRKEKGRVSSLPKHAGHCTQLDGTSLLG